MSAESPPATIAQHPTHVTSSDGRCRFVRPKIVSVRASHDAAERVVRSLEIVLGETPDHPARTALLEARFAACRAILAAFPHGLKPAPTYTDERAMHVTYDRDDVLGIVVERYENVSPSAHPNTTYAAFAFDLASGHAYRMREMFRPGSDATLRELVLGDLRKRDLAHPSEPDVAPLYASGPPHFGANDIALRRDGIDVYNLFESHAVAGLVAHVSAADLRAANIIAPRGPLRVFLR